MAGYGATMTRLILSYHSLGQTYDFHSMSDLMTMVSSDDEHEPCKFYDSNIADATGVMSYP